MSDDNSTLMGRKIFFLHPSAFVQNTVIDDLVQQEFEIYMVRNERKLLMLLEKYPNSIVFACIDEVLSPQEWEMWVRQFMENKTIGNAGIGIISSTNNDDIRQLYLTTIKVTCGFIPVKTEKAKVLKAMIDILHTANAKGRRKYLRVDTRGDTKTTINFSIRDSYVTGEVLDISVVGLSCALAEDVGLEKNEFFPDIQIKLQSSLIRVEGIVYGHREENGKKVYVLLFTSKTDSSIRTKIRSYIQKRLQTQIDEEIGSATP